MTAEIFDLELRALRRDRAARVGPELFLAERVFGDCLERLSFVRRSFRSALLIGCPDPGWPGRLRQFIETVDVLDPGPLFAEAVGGTCIAEDRWSSMPGSYDLCIGIGTLDTVNALPLVLKNIRACLEDDGLLIGALAGGNGLPRLRAAMHSADLLAGAASPHVHPRIEGPTLAALLSAAGFAMPVVDVDRVQVAYRGLDDLVRDLRRMAATNILLQRSRKPLSRAAIAAARGTFSDGQSKTIEIFEILHFAAWAPEPNALQKG